jgi:ABC-type branched-subunit amino acid transport system substrate-binding protein
VHKILNTQPEMVFASFPLEEAIKFVKALNALDTSKKVKIGCDFQVALSPEKYIEAGGEQRFEGCILVQNADTTNPEFKKRYENTFGVKLLTTGDFTYDAIGLLVELSKNTDSGQWINALSNDNYKYPKNGQFSASGNIRFNSDGTRLDERIDIKVLEGDMFVQMTK